MKRLALTAIALSMFAMPALEAQAASRYAQQPIAAAQADVVQVGQKDYRKKVVRKHEKKRVVRKKVTRKHWESGHRWKRGQRYSAWKRHQGVRDWHRHGLHRPGRGQEWIRVGNDYLLVSIASGIIAGMMAAR